ncbi:MAG: transcription factor IIA subunit alpha [Bogoriella megaspora]|nr:MAG: transcription factor IIA subunit alpha [Bogoriella megaspora]
MSNTVVGNIYAKIITETATVSQNDFEENGVEQSTLQSLQDTWHTKLSERKIAQFPWDPAPTPPASIANPPTVPSNASQSNAAPPQHPVSQNQAAEPRIKTEPYDNGISSYPAQNNYATANQVPANPQQRAAQLLQQQYGSHANASVAALQQQGLHLPGRGPAPGQVQRPQADPAQQFLREQEQMRQHQAGITNTQTDGAGDDMEAWQSLVAARRSHHHMMRAQMEQLAQQMDSGLMVPLSEHKQSKLSSRTISRPRVSPSSRAPLVPQLDGPSEIKSEFDDEKIEDDEDAINSDLDDSEEELQQDDDEDEGNSGEVMLCTYDKVQRVKNKWKCTLKDGVLTTGGKEYASLNRDFGIY